MNIVIGNGLGSQLEAIASPFVPIKTPEQFLEIYTETENKLQQLRSKNVSSLKLIESVERMVKSYEEKGVKFADIPEEDKKSIITIIMMIEY